MKGGGFKLDKNTKVESEREFKEELTDLKAAALDHSQLHNASLTTRPPPFANQGSCRATAILDVVLKIIQPESRSHLFTGLITFKVTFALLKGDMSGLLTGHSF